MGAAAAVRTATDEGGVTTGSGSAAVQTGGVPHFPRPLPPSPASGRTIDMVLVAVPQ